MSKHSSNSSTEKDTNAAKESKHLLDIISEVKNVATALEHFKTKHASVLTKTAVADLGILVLSLECIYDGGKHQTARVSRVSYLLSAYHKCQKEERKRKRESERTTIPGKASIRDLRAFVQKCKKAKKRITHESEEA